MELSKIHQDCVMHVIILAKPVMELVAIAHLAFQEYSDRSWAAAALVLLDTTIVELSHAVFVLTVVPLAVVELLA